MSRDKILAFLWPETPAGRGTHRLTQVLYSLRRELQSEELFLGTADLRLNPDLISTDVADFHQALADQRLDRVVALYSGPFLDGFFVNGAAEFEQWVDGERASLAHCYRNALEALAAQATAKADHSGAAEWYGRLTKADPLNAQAVLRYMDALARTGDRAGAIRVGRLHETRLRQELDVGPDPAVGAAVERLRTPASEEASVAVLPFLNLSPDQENDYFSDGMTEELTNALTHVHGLRVASRTSAFVYKGKGVAVEEIGARLGVKSVVEGSVRKDGTRVRITAQLVDAATGYHLWSETYDRELADIFGLQEEVSGAIVRALSFPVPSFPGVTKLSPPTVDVEAYTLYLRGRHFALKRTVASLRTAIEYFEQAIELDPDYALAHAGVGECYTLRGFEEFGDLPPREAMPRAKAALDRALVLDGELSEGHLCRGMLAFLFDYDWAAAERAFRRAVELKPIYALAHAWYSLFLTAMARHDEALTRIRHAEQLDPMSIPIQTVVGHCHYLAGRFDEALQRHLATLEIDPANLRLHAWVARIHLLAGRYEHGLRNLEAAMRLLGRPPILLASLGQLLASLGRREEAQRVLEELDSSGGGEHVSQMALAHVHRALGNKDEMFQCMDQAFAQRSGALAFLGVEPRWDAWRREPRFQDMVQRLGLPPSLRESALSSLAAC